MVSEKNELYTFDTEQELKNWIKVNHLENKFQLEDEKKLEKLRRLEGTNENEEEENRRID